MSPRELKQLLQTLRDFGVTSYKAEGLEIILAEPSVKAPKVPRKKFKAEEVIEKATQMLPRLTDEEWLLATSQAELDEVINESN